MTARKIKRVPDCTVFVSSVLVQPSGKFLAPSVVYSSPKDDVRELASADIYYHGASLSFFFAAHVINVVFCKQSNNLSTNNSVKKSQSFFLPHERTCSSECAIFALFKHLYHLLCHAIDFAALVCRKESARDKWRNSAKRSFCFCCPQ